jgi:coenzyme F420-0:L-glutamate ligase/coenzyme F420-1:gamma-L-glutamate ligase
MSITIYPLKGVPEIKRGNDLAKIIVESANKQGIKIQQDDVVVITQKVVSKAEGRVIDLNKVEASLPAKRLAKILKNDPRVVELILRESKRIVRMVKGLVICETKHGFVCANAGVDKSNVSQNKASLLPANPDKSAREIRRKIKELTGKDVAVIISDTFGRPWREGQTDVAVGVAGMRPLIDYAGMKDDYGYELKVTRIAIADELASAAELVMGKLRKIPVAIIRGVKYDKGEGKAKELVRRPTRDIFR